MILEIYRDREAVSRRLSWRWRVRAGNNRLVAQSEGGFASAYSAERGFKKMMFWLDEHPHILRKVIR